MDYLFPSSANGSKAFVYSDLGSVYVPVVSQLPWGSLHCNRDRIPTAELFLSCSHHFPPGSAQKVLAILTVLISWQGEKGKAGIKWNKNGSNTKEKATAVKNIDTDNQSHKKYLLSIGHLHKRPFAKPSITLFYLLSIVAIWNNTWLSTSLWVQTCLFFLRTGIEFLGTYQLSLLFFYHCLQST